jgi:hypothetical protein
MNDDEKRLVIERVSIGVKVFLLIDIHGEPCSGVRIEREAPRAEERKKELNQLQNKVRLSIRHITSATTLVS